MTYTCPGCGQTDEEKKSCCGAEMEEAKEDEKLEPQDEPEKEEDL